MKFLRNTPIGVKVAVAPLVAALCLIGVAGLGLWTNHSLTQSLHTMQSTTLPVLSTANELQNRIGAVYAGANQSFAWTGAEYPGERIDKLDKALTSEIKAISKLIEEQAASPLWDAAGKAQLADLGNAYKTFMGTALDAIDMKSTGLAQATTFIDMMQDSYVALDQRIAALAESQRQAASTATAAAAVASERRGQGILAGTALALTLAAAASWWCVRIIRRPLHLATELATAVAAGDLTQRAGATARDETGRVLGALQQVAVQLGTVVDEVRDTANQVDAASQEIAQGNADLSRRTEVQAARLQQTASAVSHLADSVRRNADGVAQADQLARHASAVAEQGGQAVGEVVTLMQELSAQSHRISEITAVIDGIAFQTNILALNAAVEAASAGQQGRGFAVVAGEVRSLAQRSGEAAKVIRDLTTASVERTESGSQRAQAAGETMQRVVESIQGVSAVMGEIAGASRAQADDLAQVNRSVADMDSSTQQNAALVEQAAAATESLRAQSTRLVALLGHFCTERANAN